MEPISVGVILSGALGYLGKAIIESKTVKGIPDAALGKFWQWIKPHIFKYKPELQPHAQHDSTVTPESENQLRDQLLELVKDETFFEELAKRVGELQRAGIKPQLPEKNIVAGSIENVETVQIGDKVYKPNETWTKKNIVKGDVKNVKSFRLGDG